MRGASVRMHILWRSNISPKKSQSSSNLLITSTQNYYMPDKGKTKGKHKRGERGSVEEEDQQGPKRANMADAELQLTNVNNDETSSGANEEETPPNTHAEETSLLELKEMLVDIQITVSNILRENTKLANEVAELRNVIQQQKGELINVKTALAKTQKQQDDLEIQLAAARRKINDQETEIAELYDLQDALDQYTRKNSLEIHGVPESAYTSTEEVVLKLAEALNVDINPDDVEISHKLHRKGIKPIIVKFQSHKAKARMYKERTKLKHVCVSDLYPNSTAATRVESGRIYLNENLTSYRRDILKHANQMRKDGLLTSVWSMDGKIFVKTSPEGSPIRIYEKTDLENL